MTTEYSISVDDWNEERWEMTGRDLMLSKMQEKGTRQNKEAKRRAKECGCKLDNVIYEFADEHVPMMLYAYPLTIEPYDEAIIELCERTSCTVVKDNVTDDYFLALCGGGMDLSQDVALAYIIAQRWLPASLLVNVSSQYGLSKWDKDFQQIADAIIEQSEREIGNLRNTIKEWQETKAKGLTKDGK